MVTLQIFCELCSVKFGAVGLCLYNFFPNSCGANEIGCALGCWTLFLAGLSLKHHLISEAECSSMTILQISQVLPHHSTAVLPSLASSNSLHQIQNTDACIQSQKWTSTILLQSTYPTPHRIMPPLIL